MSSSHILPFHAQILSDLSMNDGLVILARGLGLHQLIYQFVARYARTSHLVLLINVKEEMQREINERLAVEEQELINQSSSDGNEQANSASDSQKRLGRLRPINNNINAAERQRMYLTGGVIAVTSRILIVDLLNKLIDPSLIHGLMINQAHQVHEESIEAFIVRVYRQSNQAGFLKAFTDQPQAVIGSGAYMALDKLMRFLHLRSLYLYPRFQLQVAESLNPHTALPMLMKAKQAHDRSKSRSPSPPLSSSPSNSPTNDSDTPPSPDIHEMIITLTPAMMSIQRALVECMDLCVSSLKVDNRLGSAVNIKNAPLGSNPTNQSISSLSLTTSLTKSVDTIIQRELDGQWHTVTAKSKQLLHDLQLLRRCLNYLTSFDSLTFYRFLLTVKAQCQQQRDAAVWLMTEPADRLFRMAKARVYRFKSAIVPVTQGIGPDPNVTSRKSDSSVLARARAPLSSKGKKAKSTARVEAVDDDIDVSQPGATTNAALQTAPLLTPDSIEVVLEENPKWQLLRQILDEIASDIAAKLDARIADPSLPPPAGGPVVVCCHDQRTCTMLTRYLELGGRRLMRRTWNRFVLSYRPRRNTMPVQPDPNVPAPVPQQQPSVFALLTAETAALRAEATRVVEARTQIALKKFERERRRRMEREAKEKRTEKIGADQFTLTQQFQAAAQRAQQKKHAAKVTQRAAQSRKRKADQKAIREKDRRILASKQLSEDSSGLHAAARKRQKRSAESELFSGSDDETDEIEETVKEAIKSEFPEVLSVCDISLNLSQAPSRFLQFTQSQASQSSQLNDIDEKSRDSAPAVDQATGVEALAHDFDERSLHALPDFSVIFCVASNVDALLYRARPSFIVMYDVDLKLMREIEVYAATERDLAVRVYYCMYRDSPEQQRYFDSINAEKQAFDALIFQKSHMIVPSAIEGRSVGLSTNGQANDDLVVVQTEAMRAPRGDLGNMDMRPHTAESYQQTLPRQQGSTRRGGGGDMIAGGTIIVDVREVRSSLPSLLHARGFTVVPVTLEVADYVLAPHIAVERKSVPDLFGSFNSGRLIRQMEVACRHYKSPILLIEFDRKRSFQLVGKFELGTEITSKHIMSRLTLLICAFPQIRLLWSRDPHATVALFQALKQNQPQPEVDAVAINESVGMIGVSDITSRANRVNQEVQRMQRELDDSHGTAVDDDEEDERGSAMTSFDILRKLPGVNQTNVRALIDKVHSLKELCSTPLKSLMEWIGEINGRKLYQFLHSDASSLFV